MHPDGIEGLAAGAEARRDRHRRIGPIAARLDAQRHAAAAAFELGIAQVGGDQPGLGERRPRQREPLRRLVRGGDRRKIDGRLHLAPLQIECPLVDRQGAGRRPGREEKRKEQRDIAAFVAAEAPP